MRSGTLQEVQHISVSIECPPGEVYRYASDPNNLSAWASGLAGAEVERDGDAWLVDAPFGKARVTFAPTNEFGVIDHDVQVEGAPSVHNPMRVMPNGDGSEFLFSVFRQPGMSDEQFFEDTATVARDLQALKQILEDKAHS